jgi:16S rRNA (guanine1207-N2)-methyltransferase
MSHYFSERPDARSAPRVLRVPAGGVTLELATDSGVFSPRGLDRGTAVLLSALGHVPDGDLLDLGAGYGPIALTLAARAPRARVWAVEVNARARDLLRANADGNGLPNVLVRAPDEVSADVRFTAIYSNPPIRIGKAALHALLATWLDRLAPGGRATLVVHRNLGSDSLQRWLCASGWPAERLTSEIGYRVLSVGPRAVR